MNEPLGEVDHFVDAESLRAVLARALFGASSPRASSPVYFV